MRKYERADRIVGVWRQDREGYEGDLMMAVINCSCMCQACEEHTDTNTTMKMGRVLIIGDMADVGVD